MDQILEQLKGLFIGSIPTIVLFLLLVVAYGLLVRGPLDAILAERRKRTTGAEEEARAAIGHAETETALFEEKLRAARAELMQARERRQKQLAAEREQALNEARAVTQSKVSSARESIEQSTAAARQEIESMGAALSAQILKVVLPAGAAETGVTQ